MGEDVVETSERYGAPTSPAPVERGAHHGGPPVVRPGPGRPASAGRVLGVGLLCFALWLLLDARQLYESAQASPLGVRRSVAMSLLRPVAAVSGALGLTSLVSVADQALGRHGTIGGSVEGGVPLAGLGPPAYPTPLRAGAHPHWGVRAVAPARETVAPPLAVGPAPLSQPSPAHPLEILVVGDSLGEDLGLGLADVFAGDPDVRVLEDAVGDTGLARPDYYDWPAELAAELRSDRPGAVVVMLGGNDVQNFYAGGEYVAFGTPLWHAVYAARVAEMMTEATAAGAHVLWVGMPVMADPGFSADMRVLNAVYRSEAARVPGVTYFSSWAVLSAPGGRYSAYLPDSSGEEVLVRDPDGVHLAQGGYDRLAAALVATMAKAWGVRLGAGGGG
jgi:lysophospholipase L1-like esterase